MKKLFKAGIFLTMFVAILTLLAAVYPPAALFAGISAEEDAGNYSGRGTVEDAPGAAGPDYTGLKPDLENYIKDRPGTVSVFVQDLNSGRTLEIGSDRVYAAASTIKLPLVLYLYELAAEGKVDLNTTLTYTQQYYAQGTGILQGRPFGGSYTLRELSRLAIEYSDNVAWKMLLDFIDPDGLTAFEKSLGATATGKTDGLYITTPRDMGNYLRELLAFSKKSPEYGNELLYFMEHSIFQEGIPQDLPNGTVVAHKMGALNDKFHDVGIVFGKRPYIITIFTRDGWEAASLETLAGISRMVYAFQENAEKK